MEQLVLSGNRVVLRKGGVENTAFATVFMVVDSQEVVVSEVTKEVTEVTKEVTVDIKEVMEAYLQ